MLSLLFQTLLVLEGELGGVCWAHTNSEKDTPEVWRWELTILSIFGFWSFCVWWDFQDVMGSHEFPGPFPSRFVDQQKFAACRPAIFVGHENRDRRGESLKRWETWFLFGPGYCTWHQPTAVDDTKKKGAGCARGHGVIFQNVWGFCSKLESKKVDTPPNHLILSIYISVHVQCALIFFENELHQQHLHIVSYTLPETNIAHENPHLSW